MNRNWGPKLWAGITGVKFGRTELSIPPIEISRRDLQHGPIFSIFHFFDFGFRIFGSFKGGLIFANRLNRFAYEPV